MSYSRFSTKNADYWLVFAPHDVPREEDIFEKGRMRSLDAIVVENVGYSPLDLDDTQYGTLFQNAWDEKTPLYFLDIKARGSMLGEDYHEVEGAVASGSALLAAATAGAGIWGMKTKKISRRSFLKGSAGIFALSVIGTAAGTCASHAHEYLCSTKGEASEFWRKILAEETFLIPTEQITLRNAVTARKVEEHLAPRLERELGRKPRIALVYGAMHAGIKECLEDKERRDDVLEYYRDFVSKLDRKMLNRVMALLATDNGITIDEWSCGLF